LTVGLPAAGSGVNKDTMDSFMLSGLLDTVAADPAFRELVGRLGRAEAGAPIGPLGLPEAARPVVVAAVALAVRAPVMWITAQPDDARLVVEALRAYLPHPDRVKLLPAPDALPYERIPWDPTIRELRLGALASLHRWATAPVAGQSPVVVAPVRGLLLRTLSPAALAADTGLLGAGDRVTVSQFLGRLQRLGYETVSSVTQVGQVAHRGGIVDFYPPGATSRCGWNGSATRSTPSGRSTRCRSGPEAP